MTRQRHANRTRPPRRMSLALAGLLALVLLVGALPSGAARAQTPTASTEIQVGLQAGFGDSKSYLIGEWLPVRVTLTNNPGSPARRVRVEVEAYGHSDDEVIGLYGRDVDLPSRSHKELTLYTFTGSYTRDFRVNVREGNNVLAGLSTRAVPYEPPSNMIVGIASGDSTLLNALTNEQVGHVVASLAPGMGQYGYGYPGAPSSGQGATAIVAHVDLDSLPAAYQGWKPLGALLLDDVDAGSLSPEQRAALETWVAEGGTLLVTSRPDGGDSTRALADLLPVTVSGTRPMNVHRSLADYVDREVLRGGDTVGNAVLNDSASESSRVLAMQDGTVLLASRDVGRGRVIYMGLSPALPPLHGWDGTIPLMKKLLADTPVRPSYGASMRFGPSRGIYVGSLYGTYGSMFAMPGLDLPNAWIVGGFLLIYILIIGPLNFIVLRRMRRAELAWVTVPALVALFSVGAYLLAFQAKGGEVVSIRASAVNAYEDVPHATTVQNYGLFSPVRRSYRLTIPAEATVTELNAYGYYQAGSSSPALVYGGNPTVVDNVLINTWSLKAFMAEHSGQAERPLEADLRLENGMIVGTVTNRLDVPLQDVALVRGNATQHIGFVAARGSAEVRLELSSQVFDNSSPAKLLPPPAGVSAPQTGYSYPYSGRDSNAEQRTYNRKIELLSAGLYPYIGALPPLDMRVTLLAWGPPPPDPIGVERYSSQLEEATLWVSQATVRPGGQGDPSVKSGTVPYTVYTPGDSIEWRARGAGAGAAVQLAPGQAFPQPTPPSGSTAYAAETLLLKPYAEVRYSLPPGTVARTLRLDFRSAAASPDPIRVLAFNTNTGEWDDAGRVTADSTAPLDIPDPAPYVGPAGDVTLRLVAGQPGVTLVRPVLDIAVNVEGQQ